jgi:cytoplasmic iron level regulating protein YaaA (DUF328/UPF0246 family)
MLNDRGQSDVHIFKQIMTDAAERVLVNMPTGRLRSIFETKLEEAMFFGTKAFASKPGNFKEIVSYSKKGAEVTNVTG